MVCKPFGLVCFCTKWVPRNPAILQGQLFDKIQPDQTRWEIVKAAAPVEEELGPAVSGWFHAFSNTQYSHDVQYYQFGI